MTETAHQFDPTVLREYDIRGVVGRTIHPADARAIGRTFGTLVKRAGGRRVALGYDGRLSSGAASEEHAESEAELEQWEAHDGSVGWRDCRRQARRRLVGGPKLRPLRAACARGWALAVWSFHRFT